MTTTGDWQEDDLAWVTLDNGQRFEAQYTLSPSMRYFWRPVDNSVSVNYRINEIVDIERIQ